MQLPGHCATNFELELSSRNCQTRWTTSNVKVKIPVSFNWVPEVAMIQYLQIGCH